MLYFVLSFSEGPGNGKGGEGSFRISGDGGLMSRIEGRILYCIIKLGWGFYEWPDTWARGFDCALYGQGKELRSASDHS